MITDSPAIQNLDRRSPGKFISDFFRDTPTELVSLLVFSKFTIRELTCTAGPPILLEEWVSQLRWAFVFHGATNSYASQLLRVVIQPARDGSEAIL